MFWRQPSIKFLFPALFYAFACVVVLLVYIHFSTLPGRYGGIVKRNDETTSSDAQSDGTEPRSEESVETDYMHYSYTNMLPVLDFRHMGNKRKKVLLLIIISTAPARFQRRQAVRETWWKHCRGNRQVKCFFVTDGFILNDAQRDLLLQERNQYKDIELQPLLGWEFGLRFLSQIKWAYAKFDFQYFLRTDDDYFLCLKRLLAELPVRPKENLIWGHFHCEAGITWIDESFMIFTPDIIYKFLSQNESTMLCHPHADQQIGLWLNHIPTKQFIHDSRLYHHDPPASFDPKFNNARNICDSYLGIHGTYEEKMLYFGSNANDGRKEESPFPDFASHCGTTKFDHRVLEELWRYEPKLCKDNPRWGKERGMYVGRENRPA